MIRLRPTQLLARPLTRRLARCSGTVIHINDTYVYTDRYERNVIDMYMHTSTGDINFVVSYPHADVDGWHTRTHVINGHASVVFATNSMIFTAESGKFVIKYDFEEHTLRTFAYHPKRLAYMIVSGRGSITELDTKFNRIRHTRYDITDSATILPSTCSLNTYIAWNRNERVGLSILGADTVTSRTIDNSQTNPVALMRPNHADEITLLYDNTIMLLDIWHTSSAARQRSIYGASYGAYIDPNVCIIGNNNGLEIFDHRRGIVGNIRTGEPTFGVWHVGPRLYVEYSCGALYTLDI